MITLICMHVYMGIIELLIKRMLASGVGLVVCANYFLQTGQLDAQ